MEPDESEAGFSVSRVSEQAKGVAMLQVIGGAVISAAMILFSAGLIAVEFRKRWAQVIAALEMRDPALSAFDPIPPLALRPATVVARRRPADRRRPLSPGYRLAA